MTFDEYQDFVQSVANPCDDELTDVCMVLGLAGEAGEVADLYKKHHTHGHDLDQEKLAKELGDVLWYVAEVARRNNWDLSRIVKMNVDKLSKRYDGGFSHEKSINRTD